MREGVLSDESILKQCREYRPIPLGLTQQILEIQKPADYKPVLQVRKPKYLQHAPTPATFNVMSSAVAKSMDPINPAPIRQQLNAQYDKEVIDLLKEEQEPATPKQDDVGRGGASVPSPPASAEAMVGVVERVDGAIEGLSSDTR